MAYSDNCLYKQLTAKPCWRCAHHIPDTDRCGLNYLAHSYATETSNKTDVTSSYSQSYEERLRDYEKKRQEYLQLSKEALVDLIIHRPDY